MPPVRIAIALTIIVSLAACALPPPDTHSALASDCTDSYTGSRLCASNGDPATGDGFHNPAVGMDMPTHPH